ncbi:hypothetical protein [Nocardia cyriacigeorgica]|uniref:hypothetical protein n=1 Tax=Nocardia cyriacigeorgica TaxID=135487 RepID=UPI0013D20D1E|nr:hypothetical protein [Nocardia cyriacigeorgica]MBF6455280.1 hypothetical protein [Nocardia cyriacigeorgica]MBF6480533.1 hypothetical protein [Nocardia cyriacigeorgica]MBF6553978.1 hypothetical protein [Nocardia cyriacigeorgica]NEW29699.1 hypothetical protein [Nocardia cyriacigeorgica]
MTEAQIAAVCEEAHGAGMTQEMIELYTDNPRSLRGFSAVIPTLLAGVPLVKLDRSVTKIDDVVHADAEGVE